MHFYLSLIHQSTCYRRIIFCQFSFGAKYCNTKSTNPFNPKRIFSQLTKLYLNFLFQFWKRGRFFSNCPKSWIHGSYWQIICQSNSNIIKDGWRGKGWCRVGVWVLQLPFCHDRREHQLQWQHVSTLWIHHV